MAVRDWKRAAVESTAAQGRVWTSSWSAHHQGAPGKSWLRNWRGEKQGFEYTDGVMSCHLAGGTAAKAVP